MGCRYFIPFIVLLFLFSGCGRVSKTQRDNEFERAKVIPKIASVHDTNITYSLYLPSDYSEDEIWPVIFAFDAHAKGAKPVELFSAMAEKFGYILIGSNNSQNGMPIEESLRIFDVLLNDVKNRFSIDPGRIYTAGFSGGSRVASSVAIFKGGIYGVIGCSAGFPALREPVKYRFDYFGFVGSEDMNYLEMVFLESALSQSGYRHYLRVFDGKHDWPPDSVVGDAFVWLEANAMKDGKKQRDENFITEYSAFFNRQASELEKQENWYEAYVKYQMAVNYFEGLADVDHAKKQIGDLGTRTEVMERLAGLEVSRKEEQESQANYIKAMVEKLPSWWRSEMSKLKTERDNTRDPDRRAMLQRLFGYLSLSAYSNANGYLKAGQMEAAARFIELYSIIDPDNNEHAYLAALLHVKTGNPEKAFASIETLIKLGFSDLSRFSNDTVLSRLKNDTRYFDALERIRQNQ